MSQCRKQPYCIRPSCKKRVQRVPRKPHFFQILCDSLFSSIWKYHKCTFSKKNPAYGRHQLSRPMRLVEPKQNKTKCFFVFVFFSTPAPHCTAPHRTALRRTAPRRTAPHRTAPLRTAPPPPPYGREGGLTNERPGSGHVIWGPTRGLEKNRMGRGQTDRRTCRLSDQLGPEGRVSENVKKKIS